MRALVLFLFTRVFCLADISISRDLTVFAFLVFQVSLHTNTRAIYVPRKKQK